MSTKQQTVTPTATLLSSQEPTDISSEIPTERPSNESTEENNFNLTTGMSSQDPTEYPSVYFPNVPLSASSKDRTEEP